MKNSKNLIQIGKPSANDHKCTVTQEGDWVVFRCTSCNGYERRFNSTTGEMITKGTEGNLHKHYGSYIRPGFDANLYHPN